MDLKQFQQENADNRPTGKPASEVRSSGSDAQVLKTLRRTFTEVQASTSATVSSLNDSTVKVFAELDSDFGQYFTVMQNLDKLLNKFLDPKQKATKEDSAKLQELLKTEKALLDTFNRNSSKDQEYNKALLEAQERTGLELRKKSFKDQEFTRATKIWNMKQGDVFETMEQHLDSFSTSSFSDIGSNIVGGLFGQDVGYFAKALTEHLPQIYRGAKQIPGQLRNAREGARSVRDRVNSTRQLLRNRSVRSVMQSLIKGSVDITGTDFADDLLKAQEQLRDSSDQIPEELTESLDGLQETIDAARKEDTVSAESLEDIRSKAADVSDTLELLDDVETIRDEEKPAESIREKIGDVVPTEQYKEKTATTDVDKDAGDIKETTGVLTDIREAALEMMLYLDALNKKADKILKGETAASEEVSSLLRSLRSDVKEAGEESTVVVRDVSSTVDDLTIELATNDELQRQVWEAEDNHRDATRKHQQDILKTSREQSRGGSGDGGIGGMLSNMLGGKLAGKFGGKLMGKFGGSGAAKLLGKVGGSKIAKIGLGAVGAGGLANLLQGGGEAVAKSAAPKAVASVGAKTGGKGLLKTAGKTGGKGLLKTVGKIGGKGLGKSLLKKIPGIGLAAGLGFGIHRAMKGDFAGALGEVGSGAASLIPGVGTALSTAIDAGLMAKDIKEASVGENDINDLVETQPTGDSSTDDIFSGFDSYGDQATKEASVSPAGNYVEMDAANQAEIVPDDYQKHLASGINTEMPRVVETKVIERIIERSAPAQPSVAPQVAQRTKKTLDEMPVMIDDLGLLLVASSKM